MTPSSETRRRRSPLIMLLPAAVIGLVFAAWSAYWFIAISIVEREFEQALADARDGGRHIVCTDSRFRGYPFRFEWYCTEPVISLVPSSAPENTPDHAVLTMTAADLVALALAYNPRHVIIQMTGPARIDGTAPVPFALDLEWTRASTSIRIRDGGLHQLDTRVADAAAWLTPSGGTTRAMTTADSVELHLRRGGDVPARAADVAVRVLGGSVLQQGSAETPPVDAALLGRLTEVDGLAFTDTGTALRQWRDTGGEMTVDQLTFRQNEMLIDATGDLVLDALGRPDGAFVIKLAGIDPSAPLGEGVTALAAAGIGALGTPSEIDGRPAIEVDIVLTDGVARIGLLPVTGLPSLTD